ncbi:MAG: cytochrome c peroxidase [Campylobacterota bacterium]|nr:cytochrome c peroxidase [Campylobacterota bacterium]
MKYLIILILISSAFLAEDSLRQKALSKGLKSIPTDYEALKAQVDDPKNPMTISKILLGKKLFFDKNLSKDRSLACAKCHDIKKGGEDGKPTAIGYKQQENPSHLNSPTVLNTAFSKHLFWDGRAGSLREQAKGPMQAHFEMASTPELVEERVKENLEYQKKFREIFGEDSITFDNITKAIAVYEKTLVTRGRYDDFLDGNDNALNASEKRGLNLFIDMGCKGCHFGSAIGGQKIQKFPLRDYNSILSLTTTFNEETKGRDIKDISLNFKMYHPYPFENKGEFMGRDGERNFRVPILRDISKTGPYFHNGVVKTLKESIEIMSKYQVGVDMSKEQLDAMEAFLKSLDGELVNYNLSKER